MQKDRTELHDLSSEKPDIAKDLLAKWQAWAERTHVKPFPPGKNAKKKEAQKTARAPDSDN